MNKQDFLWGQIWAGNVSPPIFDTIPSPLHWVYKIGRSFGLGHSTWHRDSSIKCDIYNTWHGPHISAGKGSSSVFFCFADSSCQLSTHLADIYGQLPLGIGNSWGRGRWLLQLLLTWNYCLFRPFSAANLNFSGQSVTTPDLQRY